MVREVSSACLQTLAYPICTLLKRLLVHHRKEKCGRLCEQAGTAGLDGLDFSCGPRSSGETGGQLAAVKELAGCGLDGAEGGSGLAANEAAVLAGCGTAVQGTVLLGLLSVGSERLGELRSGSGRVGVRSVVNLCMRVRRSSRSFDEEVHTGGD